MLLPHIQEYDNDNITSHIVHISYRTLYIVVV